MGAQQKKHPVAWEIRIRMHVRARLMVVSVTKASALHFIVLHTILDNYDLTT